MTAPSRLLEFYRGHQPDHRGRMLAEILRQDDMWLESTHDFIQWLFPLPEASGASPSAPRLDNEVRQAFLDDAVLRGRQLAAYRRMLDFFGLERDGGALRPGPTWPRRRGLWFTRDTHNSLRITRMIRSLSLLGQPEEAVTLEAGLQRLCDTDPTCGITKESRNHWRRALERQPGG